jgi:hypothetical protein
MNIIGMVLAFVMLIILVVRLIQMGYERVVWFLIRKRPLFLLRRRLSVLARHLHSR